MALTAVSGPAGRRCAPLPPETRDGGVQREVLPLVDHDLLDSLEPLVVLVLVDLLPRRRGRGQVRRDERERLGADRGRRRQCPDAAAHTRTTGRPERTGARRG